MHSCRQLLHYLQSIRCEMSVLLQERENLLTQAEITLFARTPQGMFSKEWNDLVEQLPAVTHLVAIAEAVIRSAITLDIHLAASKEPAEFIEKGFVLRPEFETEARFHLGPTALRPIEMN